MRTRPFETESELPFAGLSDLIRPFLPLLDRIPERQAAVLSGALALGPPSPGDRFAAAAATLSLLAAAAEDRPLLVAVDDAHSLDAASREALLFAGRRLGSEGIVLLLATRYRTWIDTAGIDSLELKGLTPDAAASVVDAAGRRVAPHVRDRIVAETEGNPLAIKEAVATLADAQLDGSEPLKGPIPVGPTLEQALAQRLDPLPDSTRRALLVVAVSDTGDAEEIDRALSGLGLGREALVPAEDEGIIARAGSAIEFRHPLVRSAAYQSHTTAQRRTAHRALSDSLDPARTDRIAWHLAQASTGPDERVASSLEASAGRAQAQGGYAAAGRAFESAARLSEHDDDRLRRTMAAGRALWLAGEPQRASDLLESVLGLAVEPTARSDVQELRATAMLFMRPVSETHAMLLVEADRVERHDPVRAAALLATAALTRVMAADQEQAAETVSRALRAPGLQASAVSLRVRSVDAMVHAIYGEVDEALAVITPLVDQLLADNPLGEDPIALAAVPQTLRWIEQWDRTYAILDRILERSEGRGRSVDAPIPSGRLGRRRASAGEDRDGVRCCHRVGPARRRDRSDGRVLILAGHAGTHRGDPRPRGVLPDPRLRSARLRTANGRDLDRGLRGRRSGAARAVARSR